MGGLLQDYGYSLNFQTQWSFYQHMLKWHSSAALQHAFIHLVKGPQVKLMGQTLSQWSNDITKHYSVHTTANNNSLRSPL